MKFTILSHAGLAVEHDGVSIVCDPWLMGSCYWRSWWNFPEPNPDLINELKPQFIYLTHLHWDHFHGPSLKKFFDRKTAIIVPKTCTLRMIRDLEWLGFRNVIEVPHGGSVRLGSDFELHSYQFGLGVDSAAVIAGGGCTLFNCNDCKFFGLPLAQIMRDHPTIDFIFRSHSSASPIPYCIENYASLFPPDDSSYDSADQFARCALHVGARHAIPFASNHCFLHAETRSFNATATTPELAQRCFTRFADRIGVRTECVVMPPGSSWSDRQGFHITPFDFSRREEYVDQMLERHSATLARQYALEAEAVADFGAFKAYFDGLLQSTPGVVRRRYLTLLAFRVRDSNGVQQWLVDPATRRVSEVGALPEDCIVFEVHAAVVNDCARLKMFSVWTASKRLKIHLPSAAHLKFANLWMTILDLYEVDLLPLRKNFSKRALGVRLRRWREPVEVANILFRSRVLRRPFSVATIYPIPST
jgi:UDP-MurNAc hydroxylase